MIKIDRLVKAFGPKAPPWTAFRSPSEPRRSCSASSARTAPGKSTTMRMITGFMRPPPAASTVGGYDVVESPLEAKRLIGLPARERRRLSEMTVKGFLDFARRAARAQGEARRKPLQARWSSCAFLDSGAPQSIDTLSKGYRHRTCSRQAAVHDPRGPRHGRADRRGSTRTRKARGEKPDPQARQEQGDRVLDAHPGGGRRRMHARDHHRPRRIVANGTPEELRRQCPSWPAAVDAVGARRYRGKSSPHWEEWSAWMEAFRIYPGDKARAAELRAGHHRASQPGGLEGGGDVQRGGAASTRCFRRITLPDTVKR